MSEYSPTTTRVAVLPASTKTLSSVTVPVWALVYWNASASPAGLESRLGSTACVPTSSTLATGAVLKVAVTAWAWLIVTAQAPVPAQAPPQPAKVEPAAAVAVRLTTVPLL